MTENLEAAYNDAIHRVEHSICTQWAAPIKAYVEALRKQINRTDEIVVELSSDLEDLLASETKQK